MDAREKMPGTWAAVHLRPMQTHDIRSPRDAGESREDYGAAVRACHHTSCLCVRV